MRKMSRWMVAALVGLASLIVGCDLGVDVEAAARSSITSFFNSIATTAISNAVNQVQ